MTSNSLDNASNLSKMALDDKDFSKIEFLINQAASRAYDKIEEKDHQRRSQQMTAVSIVISLLVLVSGFLLREYLDYRIKNIVSQTSATSKFNLDSALILVKAQKLDSSDGFDIQTADALIDESTRLYQAYVDGNDIDSHQRSENMRSLGEPVRTIADNFAAANRLDLVEKLFKQTPLLFDGHFSITIGSVIAFNLIGASDGTAQFLPENSPDHERYQRFERLLNFARNGVSPESSLLYTLILKSMEGASPQQLIGISKSFKDLSDADKRMFKTLLRLLSRGALSDDELETEHARHVRERTEKMLRTVCVSGNMQDFCLSAESPEDGEGMKEVPSALSS